MNSRPISPEPHPTRTWTARRALVPLDGSTVAEAIIPFVSGIAPPLGLEIALLRVVPWIPPQVMEGNRTVFVDNTEGLSQEADSYLRTIADRFSTRGLRALTAVRVGDPATEILAGAHECEADVIAMTTHGRSALGRLLFGSVAEAVLRRANIPVFIVRAAEDAQRRAAA
jgi:nucleotide-binding universal stress UspA family protein